MIFLDLQSAIRKLREGNVVAFPTETIYGLAADPRNSQAVERLVELKGRREKVGISLILTDSSYVEAWVDKEDPLAREKRQALQQMFWPGPLTIVFALRKKAREYFSPLVAAENGTLAVRVSSSRLACALGAGLDGAVTATSVNTTGQPPARTIADIERYFPELAVVEEGAGAVKDTSATELPSTIIDVRCFPFSVLREGAVGREALDGWIEGQ